MNKNKKLFSLLLGIAAVCIAALGMFLPKLIESAATAGNRKTQQYSIEDISFAEKNSDSLYAISSLSSMMEHPENVQVIPIDGGYNNTEETMFYTMYDTGFNLFDYIGTLYYDGYYDVDLYKDLKACFVIDKTDPTSSFILWYGILYMYASDTIITIVIDDATGSLVGLRAVTTDSEFGTSYFESESAIFAFASIKSDVWIDDYGSFITEEGEESLAISSDNEEYGGNAKSGSSDNTYYITLSNGSSSAIVPFYFVHSESGFSCRFGSFPDFPDE